MTNKCSQYVDALTQLKDSYASEYSDYSGTMSYLSGIYEDEVAALINSGVSYFPPYPTGEPPAKDFFSSPMSYLEENYSTYVTASVGISLGQLAKETGKNRDTIHFLN